MDVVGLPAFLIGLRARHWQLAENIGDLTHRIVPVGRLDAVRKSEIGTARKGARRLLPWSALVAQHTHGRSRIAAEGVRRKPLWGFSI